MTLSRPSRLSPNQKAQLWPNPPATTREQKPNRPETRKPSPTPDAHTPAHLHVFLQPRPAHHSRSTRKPAPRPETAVHALPSGCAKWHVYSTTPLGSGDLIGSAVASQLQRLIRLGKLISDPFLTVLTLSET